MSSEKESEMKLEESNVVNQPPLNLLPPDNTHPRKVDHTLGRNIGRIASQQRLKPNTEAPASTDHKLSEFPYYTPSPIGHEEVDQTRLHAFLKLREDAALRCREAVCTTRATITQFGQKVTRVAALHTSTPEELNNFLNITAHVVGCDDDWSAEVTSRKKTRSEFVSAEQTDRVAEAIQQCMQHTEPVATSSPTHYESLDEDEDEPLFATDISAFVDYSSCLSATGYSAASVDNIHRFSSAHLANLNRLHITAANHGFGSLPDDLAIGNIASAERPKPLHRRLLPARLKNWCPDCDQLSKGETQYVTQDHGGLTCEEYVRCCKLFDAELAVSKAEKLVERCDTRQESANTKRETIRLATEAAWQRELASWPTFVSRNPIAATQVVVRDPEWLKQQPTWGCRLPATPSVNLPNRPQPSLDYLANARICAHNNLRSFAFTTGKTIKTWTRPKVEHKFRDGDCKNKSLGVTIKMCPDCTTFDTRRQNILREVPAVAKAEVKAKAKAERQWEKRLEDEGLSPNTGWSSHLSYHTSNKMAIIEHAQASKQRWGGTRVSLHSWCAEGDSNDESSVIVKSEDKGVRDYRASKLEKKDELPEAQATRNCQGCGIRFVPSRKGHKKYHSDNCRKLHHKKQQRRTNGITRI